MAPLMDVAYEHEFGPAWLEWRRVDKALDSMNFTHTWFAKQGTCNCSSRCGISVR
jgi:hypothetical protein